MKRIPSPTGERRWRMAREVQYGDQVIEENRRVRNYIRGFVEVLDDAGQEMAVTAYAGAGVHGYVTSEAFERFSGEIVPALHVLEDLDGIKRHQASRHAWPDPALVGESRYLRPR